MKTDRLLTVLYGVLIALAAISLIVEFPRVGMSAISVSIVSFFLGFATKAGYLRVQGQRVRVPIIERSRVSFSMLVVVMLSLSLATIFQVQGVISSSEDCNRQFRTALTYNADINTEQRNLANRAQDISGDRRVLLDALVAEIGRDISKPGAVMVAIDTYNAKASKLSAEYDALIKERQNIDKNRKPYAAPSCGSE
ncbi:hypothetical protein GCM10007298_38660 [Williamsia phyllosphaerae]|uniref:Uncharacterized protein n=2 Tax=Williamsia phyllosphaerae TaxID=885042 RepID=A0ABQ1V504_9NOCA|nr:hypothetical protein GCM10007298_38660 [Williamsia phyllosphaerae]